MPAKQRKAGVATDPRALDVQAAALELPETFAQCRDYGHPWAPSNVEPVKEGYRVTLKCPRCTTLRSMIRDRRGHQLESHYDYPDGYAIKGLGFLSGSDRDQIRLRSMGILTKPSKNGKAS